MAGIRGCPLRGLFSENKEWRRRLLSSSANLPTLRNDGTVTGTADNFDRVSFAGGSLVVSGARNGSSAWQPFYRVADGHLVLAVWMNLAGGPLRTADRALHESLDIRVEVAGEVDLSF